VLRTLENEPNRQELVRIIKDPPCCMCCVGSYVDNFKRKGVLAEEGIKKIIWDTNIHFASRKIRFVQGKSWVSMELDYMTENIMRMGGQGLGMGVMGS
jgi:hypothetical protein